MSELGGGELSADKRRNSSENNKRDEDGRVEDRRSAVTLRSSITAQQILQMSTNSTAAENTLSLLAFSSRALFFK